LQVLLTQLSLVTVVVVVLFCFVGRLSFLHEFFLAQGLIRSHSSKGLSWIDRNSMHRPVNHTGLNCVKVNCLEIAVVLQQVLAHFVYFVGVTGHFFVENASPYKCIQFVFILRYSLAVYIKVEVEVAADAEKVIFNVLNFFEFSEYLNVLHLCSDEFVEAFNQLFSKLERKLIFTEISKTLVDEPDMQVCY